MKPKKIKILYISALCFLALVGFACNSAEDYVGTYQAIDTAKEKNQENIIELMENGQGAWGCCEGEVLFTWYVKKNELRINTKEGGIMVGKLQKDSFTITLPGKKRLTFVKVNAQE